MDFFAYFYGCAVYVDDVFIVVLHSCSSSIHIVSSSNDMYTEVSDIVDILALG